MDIYWSTKDEFPYRVVSDLSSWYIENRETGRTKRIGRIGGPKGDGRGTNYLDMAKDEMTKRNKAWQARQ